MSIISRQETDKEYLDVYEENANENKHKHKENWLEYAFQSGNLQPYTQPFIVIYNGGNTLAVLKLVMAFANIFQKAKMLSIVEFIA